VEEIWWQLKKLAHRFAALRAYQLCQFGLFCKIGPEIGRVEAQSPHTMQDLKVQIPEE
jgi:hypothetical protein